MKKLLLSIVLCILLNTTVFAGQWILVPNTTNSWCYILNDGNLAKSRWILSDTNGDGFSEYYYFNADGFMLSNTVTPDGYQLDATGAWVLNGIVQTKKDESKSNLINTVGTNIVSSYDKKKELKSNITSKKNVEFVDTVKIGSKNWINAIRFTGNNSYIKANSGEYNQLSFEVAVKEVSDEAEYLLTIYVNNQEAEVIDDFSNDAEEITVSIDPNSEIMMVYTCTTDDGKYLSSNQKALYIRNASFNKIK